MPATLLVLNPNAAGGRAARLAPLLQQWLAQHSPDTGFISDGTIVHARERIAALPRGSRIAIAGGDGTIHQFLQVLHDGGHVLGVVPAGSGNDMARALGVFGMSWEPALQHALKGAASAMDLGQADWTRTDGTQGRAIFASSLTAGFDSSVVLRTQQGPQWLYGLPRYLLATLRELAQLRNWHLCVQSGGRTLHDDPALFCSTLNTPTFGSGMPAVPHARIDDGLLDLLVAGRFGRLPTLLMLPRLLAGWHLGHARVQTHALQELTIDSVDAHAPVPLAADGEYLGEAQQVQIRCLPRALSVVRKGFP
ncbi:diacylglycerol/lipid kinase family protein [Variovorax sp. VNK109]|uniref:diacylglycerol/lipid kinase family protein n=1 Tax=Variovorax sp. VNK109 TaxID=3400919 RepID=UPI003BFCB96B